MTDNGIIEKARLELGTIAAGMLDCSIDYLEGSMKLSKLRFDSDLEDDRDLLIFVAIDSETDDFPLGDVRKKWSHDALRRLEPEINKTVEWAKSISLGNCKSLAERFHV